MTLTGRRGPPGCLARPSCCKDERKGAELGIRMGLRGDEMKGVGVRSGKESRRWAREADGEDKRSRKWGEASEPAGVVLADQTRARRVSGKNLQEFGRVWRGEEMPRRKGRGAENVEEAGAGAAPRPAGPQSGPGSSGWVACQASATEGVVSMCGV